MRFTATSGGSALTTGTLGIRVGLGDERLERCPHPFQTLTLNQRPCFVPSHDHRVGSLGQLIACLGKRLTQDPLYPVTLHRATDPA
jgi:hypothetical protein